MRNKFLQKLFRFGIKPFGRRLEGYTYIDSPNGKTAYAYVQEYYSRTPEPEAGLKRRILYYVLFLIGAAAFLAAGHPSSPVNASGFIAAASCISIFLFLWMIYILIIMAVNKNHLTLWAFRVSAIQFLLNCMLCSIVFFLSFVFSLIFMISHSSFAWDIPGTILRFISAASFITMTVIEYKTEYDVVYPE